MPYKNITLSRPRVLINYLLVARNATALPRRNATSIGSVACCYDWSAIVGVVNGWQFKTLP